MIGLSMRQIVKRFLVMQQPPEITTAAIAITIVDVDIANGQKST